MKKPFQDQDRGALRRTRGFTFSLLVSQLRLHESMRRRISLLAERVEWITWVENVCQQYKFYWTREALWKQMRSLFSERNDWTVYEFGVA